MINPEDSIKEKTDLSLADLFIFKNSKKYPVYNWVYYKEGYSPYIVDWLLKYVNYKPKYIFDPFCGVGTTLLRAKELGVKSFGGDISPFSVLVSQIKTRNYTKKDKNKIIEYIQKLRDVSHKFKNSEFTAKWTFELFPPQAAFPKRNLMFIKRVKSFAHQIDEDWIRAFFMVALASILPQVSLIVKDGGVLRINKKKRAANAKELFFRKMKRMIMQMELIQGPEPKIYVGSAKELDYINEKDELNDIALITSPPYLNNVDYSKIYGLELSLLDYDTGQLRNQMLRSFRSKKPKEYTEEKYPVVDMYLNDMHAFIKKAKEKIQSGIFGMVVGDAVIGGKHIPVSKILAEHMLRVGYTNVELIRGAERVADVKPKKTKVGEYLILGRLQ